MKIDNNHPDFDLGLNTEFNCKKLEAEYLKYALSDRVSSKDSQTKEFAAALHEENVSSSASQKFVTEEEFAHERLGTVLDARDFLTKLNEIIPARYSSATKHGMLGLQVLVPTSNGGEFQFVCGAQPYLVPEFSTFYFNSHGVPTSEMYRGWRTVLLRLVLGGFISEVRANKVFGEPLGKEAKRYREMMFNYRNRKNNG